MVHRGGGSLHSPPLSRHGWEEERRGSGRGVLSIAKIKVAII